MNHKSIRFALCALSCVSASAAINVDLGTADAFAILGASAVTNTGPSIVNGDVGVSPLSSISGFPPGVVVGTIHSAGAAAAQAQLDLTNAYDSAANQGCDQNIASDLGGLTLLPGVYCFDSTAQLTGALTLNATAGTGSVFIFQIGSSLTTASASSVVFTGTQSGNVYWQVGSSATLGTMTQFRGNILANVSITLNTGAAIDCGRALARTGAVTMDTNSVSTDTGCLSSTAPVPEPNTASMMSLTAAAAAMVFLVRNA